MDWTEQRPHIAGALGAAIATAFLDSRWIERKPGSRAVIVTERGRARLSEFGIKHSWE